VESPRTLLQVPPAWEEAPTREPPRRGVLGRGPAPPRDGPAPAGATLLGRYRLLEKLGSGGFGVVWRAHDELLDREVAVKRIPLAPDGDSERATREALATARLAHPAIVALYEAQSDGEAFYLISELVHGETLSRLIAADELSDEEILQIGVTLAQALSHAHARGVIHRDVKPQNVLIPQRPEDRSGEADTPPAVAKLTDFGGASIVDQDALTRTGDVLGTLAYMAPEQSEGLEVGEETDLYALALVLYEALSGVNPVRGPTPAATARRIGRRLPPLERSRRDLPRPLTRALDTALEPAPEHRGTLDQLRFALEQALQRAPRRSLRGVERTARWSERRAERQAPSARPLAPPPASAAGQELGRGARRAAAVDPELELEPAEGRLSARPPTGRLAMPRALWLGLSLAGIIWLLISGRPGLGLLVAAGAAPLAALPRRSGPGWLASALAPLLGLLGLAGAFPAIAGQASRWRSRAALAALGYWWLTLAEPLAGRRLWLGAPATTTPRTGWDASLGGGAHVLGPLFGAGLLLGAALWACGAVVLPWILRGRSAALDVIAATAWSAALAAAAPLLDSGLSTHALHPQPRGIVLGAILGGAIAVAARALRGPI
jgi:hypothetical protein